MKKKSRLQKNTAKKNPGKARREAEKELSNTLRGERIPGTRVVKDKRRTETKKRMEKEMREQ